MPSALLFLRALMTYLISSSVNFAMLMGDCPEDLLPEVEWLVQSCSKDYINFKISALYTDKPGSSDEIYQTSDFYLTRECYGSDFYL